MRSVISGVLDEFINAFARNVSKKRDLSSSLRTDDAFAMKADASRWLAGRHASFITEKSVYGEGYSTGSIERFDAARLNITVLTTKFHTRFAARPGCPKH